MSRLVIALLIVAHWGVAIGDIWQRTIDGKPSVDLRAYEHALARGDEAANAANSKSSSLPQIHKDLETAVLRYREAARLLPTAGEPHFRIGSLIYSFFFECDLQITAPPPTCMGPLNEEKARTVIGAWETFEALAPLDPRVTEILLSRAILRTKLVALHPTERALLDAARRDYEAVLTRSDSVSRRALYLVLGNLAETYMMLGDLDKAIETYKDAYRAGALSDTIYGYAVALDRDDRTAQALTLIRTLGGPAAQHFRDRFNEGAIFFVPSGEEHYYFALIYEAFGNVEHAIREWRAFIYSGAHPAFQPRAREHFDALTKQRNFRIAPPIMRDTFPAD